MSLTGIRVRRVSGDSDTRSLGGKINNFSSLSVIYNKHISLLRFSFADIFLSLNLKLFAHRTKIHKCFSSFFSFVSSLRCCKARKKFSVGFLFFSAGSA